MAFVNSFVIWITLSSTDDPLEAKYAQLLNKLLVLSRFSSHLAMLGRYRIFFSISCFSCILKNIQLSKLYLKNHLHTVSSILFLAFLCKLYFLYCASKNAEHHLQSSLFLEVEISKKTMQEKWTEGQEYSTTVDFKSVIHLMKGWLLNVLIGAVFFYFSTIGQTDGEEYIILLFTFLMAGVIGFQLYSTARSSVLFFIVVSLGKPQFWGHYSYILEIIIIIFPNSWEVWWILALVWSLHG